MRLTDKQKIEVLEKYQAGESQIKLASFFGVSKSAIQKLLKRRGIASRDKRKYSCDDHYFDFIDNENKAYWLGFLYADGNNLEKRNLIRLQLQETDREILEKFNQDLKSDRPLNFVEYKKKHPTWSNQFVAIICSKHMSKQLSFLGCHNNKTFTLKFPQDDVLPACFIKHFLRGLWDGDGSFSIYSIKNKPRLCSSVVSTLVVCSKIKRILKEFLNINCCICKTKNKKTSTRRLRISGTQQVYRLLTWLYNDATIYLQRKHSKFKECIQLMENYGTIFERFVDDGKYFRTGN